MGICMVLAACAGHKNEPAPKIGNAGTVSTAGSSGEAAEAWTPTDSKIHIRLQNLSDSLTFTHVLIMFPGDSARIPSIGPKGYSEYLAVDSAYRYAFVEAKAGKQTYFCQPMDYVGEALLEPGRYTYALTPVANQDLTFKTGFLRLELLKDKEQP
ncbi:MAG: hypothetical protein M3Y08_13525 [Fibrobacterota bacterium]|nr:hypothetical protein [Fibrobacterota bacterium]